MTAPNLTKKLKLELIPKKKHKLKRELGLLECTFYGIGVILGAGIYALIGKAAGIGGPMVWVSFALAAIIAAFTGLSYAELSSMFPKDASEYAYAENAFNKRLAFIVGWLLIIAGVVSSAAVALGFAGYFSALFHTPQIPAAITLIFVLSLLSYWGIKESAWFNIVFTLIEAGGLLIIIAMGMKYIGTIDYFELPPTGFVGVLGATSLIFFAFIGFEDIVKLAEETKKPREILPKALIISIIVSTIIYILVAISAVSIMNWQALAASPAPLADVAKIAMGSQGFLMLSAIALFSTTNTVLIILIATSRIIYGMADMKALPEKLALVHKTRRTPHLAVALMFILTSLFILIDDITLIASMTDFAIFVTFILVNASLIALRYKKPKVKRAFKVPLNIGSFSVIAFLGIILNIYFIFHLEFTAIIAGSILLLAGLGLYEAYNFYKNKK